MNPLIHEQLINLSNYSTPAVITLSKLRREIALQGYNFDLTQRGCPVLLIEAARILESSAAKQLVDRLLREIGIDKKELQF